MMRRALQTRMASSTYSTSRRTFCISNVIQTNEVTKDSRPVTGHDDFTFDPYTPYITTQEHRQRQGRLVSLIHDEIVGNTRGAVVNGVASSNRKVSTLVLIPSTRKTYQADTQIPLIHLKQNADFTYLTGFNTKSAVDCVLGIIGDSQSDGDTSFRSVLFVPYHDDHQMIWEGNGLLTADNESRLNNLVDEVKNVHELPGLINDVANQEKSRLIFTTRPGLRLQSNIKEVNDREIKPGTGINGSENVVKDVSYFIDQLKVIKSTDEMKCMIRTGLIGSNALQKTINWSREQFDVNNNKFNLPLVNEFQISSMFDHESRVNGAVKVAYPTVCAGGQRSTIIHYGSNDKFVSNNDWILMDAGCEDIEGYNSDITRCWPMSTDGNVSKLHSDLYQALTEVHSDLIKKLVSTPGMSLDQLFQVMCSMLGQVLLEFGAISKSSSQSEANKAAFHFCPHHVSHYLGLDVHDAPTVPRNIPLQPGMCFTVEPGLYFRPSDPMVKDEFKGIGIRVEDDLLIKPDGNIIVLSEMCKTIN